MLYLDNRRLIAIRQEAHGVGEPGIWPGRGIPAPPPIAPNGCDKVPSPRIARAILGYPMAISTLPHRTRRRPRKRQTSPHIISAGGGAGNWEAPNRGNRVIFYFSSRLYRALVIQVTIIRDPAPLLWASASESLASDSGEIRRT